AARKVLGKAILYAARTTRSMEQAMAETARRRDKQIAYNAERGIVPKTIVKAVADVMEGARAEPEAARGKGRAAVARRVAEPQDDYRPMSPQQIGAVLKKLEARMYPHAKDLEFEEAGKLRDEIRRDRKSVVEGKRGE